MASINSSTLPLACNYAVSKVVGDSKRPYLGVPKRMPIIKAQSQNSMVELEEVDKLRRASLFGLGAALVATPFSSPAFADVTNFIFSPFLFTFFYLNVTDQISHLF